MKVSLDGKQDDCITESDAETQISVHPGPYVGHGIGRGLPNLSSSVHPSKGRNSVGTRILCID